MSCLTLDNFSKVLQTPSSLSQDYELSQNFGPPSLPFKNLILSFASCNDFADKNRPYDNANATKWDMHRGQSENKTAKNFVPYDLRDKSDSRVDTPVKFATICGDFMLDLASEKFAVLPERSMLCWDFLYKTPNFFAQQKWSDKSNS